jgi:AcrR family transcriptional regulator
VRRAPAQKRGEQRLHAILDAAAALLAERGFDGLTLTDVSERSQSSIGSLYRFFSSKEQLVEALAHRTAAAIDSDAESKPAFPLESSDVDRFVGWYVPWMTRMFQLHPEIGALLHEPGPHCAPLQRSAMQPIVAFLSARGDAHSSDATLRAAAMAMQLAIGALKLPAFLPGTSQESALGELRVALSAYLAAKIVRRY